MRRVLLFGSLLLVAAALGCASAPLKTEASTSGIRAAEEVGAKDVPQAKLHLELAKESLDRATKLWRSCSPARSPRSRRPRRPWRRFVSSSWPTRRGFYE